jgi:restriction endonuclease S subunit
VARKRTLIERLKEKRTALISRAVTRGLPPDAATQAGLDPHPNLKPSGIDWLGDVPEHWEVERLKFVLEAPLKYGANEAAELDDPELPRYVRITDIDEDGGLRDETFRSLPMDIAAEYLLREGDILFARSGATAGKTFLYRQRWGTCAFAGYLIRARVADKKVSPAFLRHFTDSGNYWQWISSALIQATIQNVSAERYGHLWLPLPPRAEQGAIVEYLDRKTAQIETMTAKAGAAIERLQEYRTALITAAVTGKIDVRRTVA